jgi:hypothetical protein
MDRNIATHRAYCLALTKKALWRVVLLSSLGLWAGVWAAAASLASVTQIVKRCNGEEGLLLALPNRLARQAPITWCAV